MLCPWVKTFCRNVVEYSSFKFCVLRIGGDPSNSEVVSLSTHLIEKNTFSCCLGHFFSPWLSRLKLLLNCFSSAGLDFFPWYNVQVLHVGYSAKIWLEGRVERGTSTTTKIKVARGDANKIQSCPAKTWSGAVFATLEPSLHWQKVFKSSHLLIVISGQLGGGG